MSDEQLIIQVMPLDTDRGKFTYQTRMVQQAVGGGDEYYTLLEEMIVLVIKPRPRWLGVWLWRRLIRLLLGFSYGREMRDE